MMTEYQGVLVTDEDGFLLRVVCSREEYHSFY